MWLLTTFIAAFVASGAWYFTKGKYQLGFLSRMLWGTTLMILVDRILGYEGGPLLETKTSGLVPNSTVLGLVMMVPVLTIWSIAVLRSSKHTSLVHTHN